MHEAMGKVDGEIYNGRAEQAAPDLGGPAARVSHREAQRLWCQ